MENKPEWHYWQKMNDVTKKKMLKELNVESQRDGLSSNL